MSFVKVKPLDSTEEDAPEFFLAIDRISSFHDAELLSHEGQAVTKIRTVYGTNFHVAGQAVEFADTIRTAIYNFTYFPPQT